MPHLFKPAVTDLSEVPEPFHGLYQQDGDAYKMAPEVFAHVDPRGYNEVLENTRKKLATYRKQAEEFLPLGANADEIRNKLTQLEELASKGGKDAQAFEKWKSDLETTSSAKLAVKDQELSDMMASLQEHLVDSEAIQAITSNDGNPVLLSDTVKKQTRVVNENGKYLVRVVDREGDPRSNGAGGYMTIKDFVAELKSKPDYAGAFRASGNTGTGAKAGSAITSTGMGGAFGISRADAADTQKYRAAKEAAAKAGVPLKILD
jgi:hypothetical protein